MSEDSRPKTNRCCLIESSRKLETLFQRGTLALAWRALRPLGVGQAATKTSTHGPSARYCEGGPRSAGLVPAARLRLRGGAGFSDLASPRVQSATCRASSVPVPRGTAKAQLTRATPAKPPLDRSVGDVSLARAEPPAKGRTRALGGTRRNRCPAPPGVVQGASNERKLTQLSAADHSARESMKDAAKCVN